LCALVALLVVLAATPAGAATIVLDFEEEALASYDGVPFISAECGCVELAETDRGWLTISDELGSRVLIAGEEGGRLQLTFLTPVTAIALDFGHDLADAEFLGDALLEGLVGGMVVASTTLAANANGLVDQTISLAYGGPLDQARFALPQSGESEPTSPYIDNIMLTTPEPGTLGLVALALGVAVASRASLERRKLGHEPDLREKIRERAEENDGPPGAWVRRRSRRAPSASAAIGCPQREVLGRGEGRTRASPTAVEATAGEPGRPP
jgi:hypothetical protein